MSSSRSFMSATQPCTPAEQTRSQLRAWFAHLPGSLLGQMEREFLEETLSSVFGYHLLQVGYLGWDTGSVSSNRIRHRVVLDEARSTGAPVRIHASPRVMPIASDSIDALVLVHTLEFEPEPHQVLREADRVLIPEGRLIVFTFNPWSLCGLWQLFHFRAKRAPWCGQFFSPARLADWLGLLGFEIEIKRGLLYRPPVDEATALEKLRFIEHVGRRWLPSFAGVHVMVARKRVSTLTPIRPRWRPHRQLKAAGIAEPSARFAACERAR